MRKIFITDSSLTNSSFMLYELFVFYLLVLAIGVRLRQTPFVYIHITHTHTPTPCLEHCFSFSRPRRRAQAISSYVDSNSDDDFWLARSASGPKPTFIPSDIRRSLISVVIGVLPLFSESNQTWSSNSRAKLILKGRTSLGSSSRVCVNSYLLHKQHLLFIYLTVFEEKVTSKKAYLQF